VILLDNVAFHHARQVAQVAEAKKLTLLYVPPYSPWYNPVETVFSLVKRRYYQCHTIDTALSAANSGHIKAAFAHSFGIFDV
jgi:transposase